MKLRNKKTWEIGWLYCDHISIPKKMTVFAEERNLASKHWDYTSLAELNAEWEDAPEEPKGIQCIYYVNHFDTVKLDGVIVGFGSKEEAELAVRKLKAWTRLEDKGFRFTAWKNGIFLDGTIAGQVRYEFPIDNKDDIEADLDLLFSGEDD